MSVLHPLDRPVWNAFTARQAALARSDGRALRLEPDYGIFVAAADPSPESLAALAALVLEGDEAAMVEAEPWPDIPGLAAERRTLVQMVAEAVTPADPPAFEIVPLGEAEAAEMLALATLTKPGPFRARTHELGDFVGVKQDGRLIAMAGERMKPAGFTEVSGVCTLPEHRGRGYAGALMRVVAARILQRGETPFLHSYAHNAGAIGLYRSLGFEVRRQMIMTVLTRPGAGA
ncbi:GNAT family N-acetyltransferase [Phenylobacterium sp.]|uniref:GNAT family N-acetyltransferase n=1 Tax=Phenylobacterium sp. TaxID=1871053 RepID=UPI0035B2D3F5